MGGRGSSAGRGNSTSASGKSRGGYGVSGERVEKAGENYVSSLRNGEDIYTFDGATIIQAPNDNGYAKIDVDYSINRKIMTGYDVETNTPEYSYEKEYSSDTIMAKVAQPKVKKNRRMAK